MWLSWACSNYVWRQVAQEKSGQDEKKGMVKKWLRNGEEFWLFPKISEPACFDECVIF